MRIHEKCKCGAEFDARGFWGPSSQNVVGAWVKWNSEHSRRCLGVRSYRMEKGAATVTLVEESE